MRSSRGLRESEETVASAQNKKKNNFHDIKIKVTPLTPQTRYLLSDEVGEISKYKNIRQNDKYSNFTTFLLNSNSMTVLSQAASKANCPRRSVDLTRHGQN